MNSVLSFKCLYRFIIILLSLSIASCAVGDADDPGAIDPEWDSSTRSLKWTAPGDDGSKGRATEYFVRFFVDEKAREISSSDDAVDVENTNTQDILRDNFSKATLMPNLQSPKPAGEEESFLIPRLDVTGKKGFFFGVAAMDEVGNRSNPARIKKVETPLLSVKYQSEQQADCPDKSKSVAAGNFNGDNLNDVAIGDPCLGKVYIFFGREETNIDLSKADVTISGEKGIQFGASLQGLPSFSGDSADELIIGAPGFDDGKGKVFVVFGNRSWSSDESKDTITIDVKDQETEKIEIEEEGGSFGSSLSSGRGVIGGSGVFVVGAPGVSKVYVFEGTSGQPKASFSDDNAAVDSRFGHSIALLGDIDRDGNNELGVGAPGSNKAYVIFGDGSLEGKDMPDISNKELGVVVLSGDQVGEFGFSISGGVDADIDRDDQGAPDVIVGAPGAGAVFLYSGWDIKSALEGDRLSNLSHKSKFVDPETGSRFGSSVSVIPYLAPNKDDMTARSLNTRHMATNAGFAVGAPGSKKVFLFFGQKDLPKNVDAKVTDGLIKKNGKEFGMVVEGNGVVGNGFGKTVRNLGDVNGDWVDDFGVVSNGSVHIFY